MVLGGRMGESLRCSPGLRLVRGLRLGHGLQLQLLLRLGVLRLGQGLLLLQLQLLELLQLRLGVLLLGGRCFVLAQTAGLSCTVDLPERVQRLALGVLQQVGLALGGTNRSHVCQQHTNKSTLK